jgi:hypothetical protein
MEISFALSAICMTTKKVPVIPEHRRGSCETLCVQTKLEKINRLSGDEKLVNTQDSFFSHSGYQFDYSANNTFGPEFNLYLADIFHYAAFVYDESG